LGNLKGRDDSEDLGVEDNITVDLKEIRSDGVDWMLVVPHMDQWKVLVNIVMNFHVHRRQEIS